MAKARVECALCLELVKDPIITICGHIHCRRCIIRCWNDEEFQCSQCPDEEDPPENIPGETGDVPCDVCAGSSVKSCVECLISLCPTHLDHHENMFREKKHVVIQATDRLQRIICSRHQKLQEYFCLTDQKLVCVLCVNEEHRNHNTVSTAAQREETRKQLMEKQGEFRLKIQQQEDIIQQLRDSVESHKRSARRAVDNTEKVFPAMIQSFQRRCDEVKRWIRDEEETAVSEAQGVEMKLQQEIKRLKRKDEEIEKLLQTQDPISFILSFPSVSAPLTSADVSFPSFPSFKIVNQSVLDLRDRLDELCTKMKMIHDRVPGDNIDHWSRRHFLYCKSLRKPADTLSDGLPDLLPEGNETEKFMFYVFYWFTLDMNTMNKHLRVSWGNTVYVLESYQSYPDHPDRFDYHPQVLCVGCVIGCCYWELDWTGDGVCVSVSYKSISRKGESEECVFGCNDQSWGLLCSSSGFSCRRNNITTALSVSISSSGRVGVFVDYDAGTLSFYNVSDTMSLIHRLHTTFTQPICPGAHVAHGSSVKLCDMLE